MTLTSNPWRQGPSYPVTGSLLHLPFLSIYPLSLFQTHVYFHRVRPPCPRRHRSLVRLDRPVRPKVLFLRGKSDEIPVSRKQENEDNVLNRSLSHNRWAKPKTNNAKVLT